ncbi:helix-turn-helix domain-containing protein [Tessaracoccus rhinocerotis]|uniref:Helix-turn-helix domain-containing protein n=1 Tax=Tessaracoccus rhinocerotis TaxID=1689449 RepID=A0A553JZD8_9ACTN|nr:helix-turn-helix domain-containing protein [Tessaracoccus rhinocerotis]TRY17810.1 helix-turn-helix domain-containing protein [Tessaracoccus rhinocerotis]
MTPRLLYTPEQASEQLSIGRTKIFELIRQNKIESIQIGSLRRIPHSALEAFIDNRRDHH